MTGTRRQAPRPRPGVGMPARPIKPLVGLTERQWKWVIGHLPDHEIRRQIAHQLDRRVHSRAEDKHGDES